MRYKLILAKNNHTAADGPFDLVSGCVPSDRPDAHHSRPVSSRKTSEAQAMVEFLLVAPLFFFLIFAVFDFGRLFLTQMEVENAVQEAGRFASTGNHLPDPNNPGQYLSRPIRS
jgi:TadE-like protein